MNKHRKHPMTTPRVAVILRYTVISAKAGLKRNDRTTEFALQAALSNSHGRNYEAFANVAHEEEGCSHFNRIVIARRSNAGRGHVKQACLRYHRNH